MMSRNRGSRWVPHLFLVFLVFLVFLCVLDFSHLPVTSLFGVDGGGVGVFEGGDGGFLLQDVA
jgi:hypothetical protein